MKNIKSLIYSTLTALMISPTAHAVKIYTTGNTADVQASTSQLLCLAGGASNDLWAEGWRQLLLSANGGDVVIINAEGQRGDFESWIYKDTGGHGFPKVDSVSTIILTRADDGNRADVNKLIDNAELVFFAGGDQSNYLKMIEGTQLEYSLNQALHVRKIPFGGTSAGMAILAGIDFTAKYAPSKKSSVVTSEDAMKNPTAQFVDLDRNTLIPEYMNEVITDTHFSQRNRKGRLVAFMARAVYNNYTDINIYNIKGIGADEGTAACIDSTGTAKVYGANSVYFARANALIERIMAGTSLDWFAQRQAVSVYQIRGSDSESASFDMQSWIGTGGQDKFWYVDGTDALNPVFGEN